MALFQPQGKVQMTYTVTLEAVDTLTRSATSTEVLSHFENMHHSHFK